MSDYPIAEVLPLFGPDHEGWYEYIDAKWQAAGCQSPRWAFDANESIRIGLAKYDLKLRGLDK